MYVFSSKQDNYSASQHCIFISSPSIPFVEDSCYIGLGYLQTQPNVNENLSCSPLTSYLRHHTQPESYLRATPEQSWQYYVILARQRKGQRNHSESELFTLCHLNLTQDHALSCVSVKISMSSTTPLLNTTIFLCFQISHTIATHTPFHTSFIFLLKPER